jgi:hypothetical protein
MYGVEIGHFGPSYSHAVTQNNKLSLIGMQLPEKYKEKFDFSSEGPSYLRKLLNILYFCIRASTKFLKALIFLLNNPEIP